MSKQFNNSHGTTSTAFEVGAGFATSARHFVLTAVCNGNDAMAGDRFEDSIDIVGTEFYDLKVLAVDSTGKRFAKHQRGTIAGGNITKIEDIFEEEYDGNIELSLNGTSLMVTCKNGSATSATYSIYIMLQRVS
jgi:hypothetical protein